MLILMLFAGSFVLGHLWHNNRHRACVVINDTTSGTTVVHITMIVYV